VRASVDMAVEHAMRLAQRLFAEQKRLSPSDPTWRPSVSMGLAQPLRRQTGPPESEAALHDLGMPMDAGAPTARKVVRDAGHKFSNEGHRRRSQTAKSARAYG